MRKEPTAATADWVTHAGLGMVMALSLAGCSDVGVDANVRAARVNDGATERQLIEAAGAPTRRFASPNEECRRRGGTYELAYDISTVYLGGWLGETHHGLTQFCMASDSTILSRVEIEF